MKPEELQKPEIIERIQAAAAQAPRTMDGNGSPIDPEDIAAATWIALRENPDSRPEDIEAAARKAAYKLIDETRNRGGIDHRHAAGTPFEVVEAIIPAPDTIAAALETEEARELYELLRACLNIVDFQALTAAAAGLTAAEYGRIMGIPGRGWPRYKTAHKHALDAATAAGYYYKRGRGLCNGTAPRTDEETPEEAHERGLIELAEEAAEKAARLLATAAAVKAYSLTGDHETARETAAAVQAYARPRIFLAAVLRLFGLIPRRRTD